MIVPFPVCVHEIHPMLCASLIAVICCHLLCLLSYFGSVPARYCHPLFVLLSTALAPFVVKKSPCRRSRRLQISNRKVVNFPTKRQFFHLPLIGEDLKSSIGLNEVIYFTSTSILFIRNFVKVIVVLNVITCYLSF